MFYPREMTEIELIVPAKDLLAVTTELSGQGVFHQTDSSYLSSEAELSQPNVWQEKAGGFASLERRLQSILMSLEISEGTPPAKGFEGLVELEPAQQIVEQIEVEVKKTSEQLAMEYKRVEQLESLQHQLQPVADIDIDLSQLRSPRFLYSVLGLMPVDNIERLQTSLSRIPFVFMPLHQDSQKAVVWLAGPRSNADVLERAARSAYLNPLSLPEEYSGKPVDIIASMREDIAAAQKKIAELKGTQAKLHETHQKQVRQLLWDVRASRMLTDAIVRYGRLKYTYLIVGWVISSRIPNLTQRLKKISSGTLIETFPAARDSKQNVPVDLDTPGFMRPFQLLVTTYARPRYDELDPTFLIAITFPLLFGAMFGDVGQGLVLAVLGWLLANKKIPSLISMASLGGIITACGLSATVFGFLYGSIFGVEHVIPALWLHPMEHILDILMVAIGLGFVLLTLGFLINIFNAARNRDWGHLIFSNNGIAGLVLYWSLLGLGAGAFLGGLPVPSIVFVILAVIAGVCVMFSELFIHLLTGHRPLMEEGPGTFAIQAFFELFETLISFLSNSLSYVRVGAFAVAHAGLSAVIFILAELASPNHGVGYYIVVVLGNVFIIGFEGLIVGIQTMRLEYYEFFSKFFKGGGARYEPLLLPKAAED
jgi:V/A-type H+-transporting ATPase subunit I